MLCETARLFATRLLASYSFRILACNDAISPSLLLIKCFLALCSQHILDRIPRCVLERVRQFANCSGCAVEAV